MALLLALIGVPAAGAVGLTLLLNDLHARAGVAAASLGLLVVLGGAALGYFVDRLPKLPARRGRPGTTRGHGVSAPK